MTLALSRPWRSARARDRLARLANYKDALAGALLTLAVEPNSISAKRAVASCYDKIADEDSAIGKLQDALNSHRASNSIRQHLLEIDPYNFDLQVEILTSKGKFSQTLQNSGDLVNASAIDIERLIMAERILELGPSDVKWRHYLARILYRVGWSLAVIGNTSGAKDACIRGIELMEKLVFAEPGNGVFRHDLEQLELVKFALLYIPLWLWSAFHGVFKISRPMFIRIRLVLERCQRQPPKI